MCRRHMGDARVTCSSRIEGLCISTKIIEVRRLRVTDGVTSESETQLRNNIPKFAYDLL